jgi:hypothetical protein
MMSTMVASRVAGVDTAGVFAGRRMRELPHAGKACAGSAVLSYLHIPFERYADDIICHCKSAEEARALWSAPC